MTAAAMFIAAATTLTSAAAPASASPPSSRAGAAAVVAPPDADHVPCDRHLGAVATYHADGATYVTDAEGRPVRAEADNVTRSPADRGPCQRKVGHMAEVPGYDGGHLIAATLHGVDERYDLVPQWASVNRGLYERMESGAKTCLTAPGGQIAHYRIRVTYPDATTVVPDLYYTDIAVDTDGHAAQTIRLTIPNRALEKAEYTKLRGELDQRLSAAGCTAHARS